MTMNKTYLAIALLALSAPALAGGQGSPNWGTWVAAAGAGNHGIGNGYGHIKHPPVPVVPAGTATYNGTTAAVVSDISSGTEVNSASTGVVSIGVTFSGTGTTTEAGTITGLTGAGATIGDLAFTASGTGSKFKGTVTSTLYPLVIGTLPDTTTGTGRIKGDFSMPVVVGTVISAPLSASGTWHFDATSTLSAKGAFSALR